MKSALQILMLVTFASLVSYGQQSDKPPSRAEKPAPSSASTPQTPGEQPAQPQPQRAQPESPAQQRRSETAAEEGSLRPIHFDMPRIPPVQTHHETHFNGKLLRYTPPPGRSP